MIANLLTALRLCLVIPVAWACAHPEWLPPSALMLMMLVAIASDYFDGKVARRMNTASARGQLFDHSTDFLFVTGGLFGAAYAGLVTIWLPILIVLAFSQYVIDSYWLYHQKQLRMSMLGRWNGVFYFVPLVGIALSRLDSLSALSALLMQAVYLLGLVLLLSTLASIVDRAMAPLRAR